MKTICSNSDVNNDVLFRQEDKNCHQVKMWLFTQQLVIKSIVLNFGLQKEAFAMHLSILISDQDQDHVLAFFLYIFVMIKFCLY